VSGVAFRAGKRLLCVGHGERCFACGGRGNVGLAPRRTVRNLDADRCPVCRGRGRARVVRTADGR
jgi:DnaJ-class molecular chaperone